MDEFQDINPLDLALLKAIVKRNRATITIVGDDDQAVFEWRRATPEYILKPEHFFEMESSTYTLAPNYRSPSNIVEMSQQLIARNSRRVEKTIRSARTDNDIFFVDPPFLHLAEYAIRYDDDYIQFIEDVERAKEQLAYIPPFDDDDKPSSIERLFRLHFLEKWG